MPHYSRLPRIALMDKLMAQGVELRPGVQVIQLLPGGIWLETEAGKKQRLEADTIILANGRQGDREAVEQFSGAAPTVTAIGGCSRSVSLRECIHGGYFAGRNIEYY